MQEHRDREHILVVTKLPAEPDFAGEIEYELEHTPDCAYEEGDALLGDVRVAGRWTCMTGVWWDEFGHEYLDLDEHPLEPGRYVVQGWHTPPGWAGSFPIEADGGIDLLGKEGELDE
jgi:hypothetical protein